MGWKENSDGYFIPFADYTDPEHLRAFKAKRSDDKTYVTESRNFKLPSDGDGPIAMTARTKRQQHLANAPKEMAFQRADLASEFGVKSIYFQPIDGGVLE